MPDLLSVSRRYAGGWRCALPAFILALFLSGCAAFRSYDTELHRTLDQASNGNVDGAIKVLESNNRGDFKDLLYYLELGMLQRLGDRYPDSQKSWMSANAYVQAWEHTAQTNPAKLLPGAASYLINDKVRTYEGHDYEKVMLLTYIALNFLAMGEYENARVAIKQTHELEAVIAELRRKEIVEVEQDAQKRGARTSFKELNGYPVQSIDNPAVNALKNSYQSALSHYLAGFVYESLGEPSLAAPGYRLANELQPNQPLLEEALSGLDQRVSAPDDGLTDVLFVIGSGTAPALQSRQFRLPMPINRTLILLTVSFPVMVATSIPYLPGQIRLDDRQALTVAPITSIDLMARRSLKDDMPGIMLRAAIRSTTKAVAQYQL
ncbi:MAG: COG3014 family protein, partial [Burkholderiales bacterium]